MKDLNPEQVRRIREQAAELNQSAQPWDEARMTAYVMDLADSWLAQGEALAAAQRALERINEESTHYDIAAVYLGWIAREALASLSKAQ